ncbi:MAG: AbrB/MazE/SpoVT family DNA-binding domain-containing protein [Acidobacteria bacterium]|nr:AbrB/MazE/SpoVT family DNA-binding domain-containing protein [Acidobacteriota bacterium]
MRITSKGQVTIPLSVRRNLGMLPGTEVEIVENGDLANIVKSKNNGIRANRGEQLVALLSGSATDKRFTTDEILAMTRGED